MHAIISSLSLSLSVSLMVRLCEINSCLSSLSYPTPPTALPTSLSVRRSCLPFSSFVPPCEIYSCSTPTVLKKQRMGTHKSDSFLPSLPTMSCSGRGQGFPEAKRELADWARIKSPPSSPDTQQLTHPRAKCGC
jgi:hypothetical protein